MLIDNQHPKNKSMMVCILGLPNVGKSSLVNSLLGLDLSIVSHLPQTTRNTFQCVFNIDRTEIILVDTPGIHKSGLEMNKRMMGQTQDGSKGTDLNIIVLDAKNDRLFQMKEILSQFQEELGPTWIVINKIDLIDEAQKETYRSKLIVEIEEMKKLIPEIQKVFVISCKNETNINELTIALCDKAPLAPHLYNNGAVSNKSERFFASEYIREQLFHCLKEELPYETAVLIDEFKDGKNEFGERTVLINAVILVNRPGQRAIVIGRGGSLIKEIGVSTKAKLEELTQAKVTLNLHVKVSPRWFKNNFVLTELGLPRVQDSARVWRQSKKSSESNHVNN
jgi:GTP-binding protein Era